MTKTAVWR